MERRSLGRKEEGRIWIGRRSRIFECYREVGLIVWRERRDTRSIYPVHNAKISQAQERHLRRARVLARTHRRLCL